MNIPLWLQSALWGLLSGSALLIGALIGYYKNVPKRWIAYIMGFGAGVLISALSFDLMDEAYHAGGFIATGIGFLCGALIYSLANYFISLNGAKHRKRSGDKLKEDGQGNNNGLSIAIGALLDGIPESIAIGVSMVGGSTVSLAAVIAVFISNIPEGLSSSTGMKKAQKSKTYIFGLWIGIALISSFSSFLGYSLFSGFSPEIIAACLAVAAGAILCMLADTMIPEAFEGDHNWIGLIIVFGFLSAFILNKIA